MGYPDLERPIMTDNLDAEIMLWVQVAKGDVDGHPFHGNQYTEGNGSVSMDDYSHRGPGNSAVPGAPVSADDKVELPKKVGSVPVSPKSNSPRDIARWANAIHFSLLRGQMPVVHAKDFPALLAEMARTNKGGNDITKVRINGTRLMGLDGKGYLRSQMPQIDTDDRPNFLNQIKERYGITSTPENVDPTTLAPIQKEVNGNKSGGIMKAFPEGIPDKLRILISKDGYVLDGHHTWAAAVALKFAGAAKTMPVYRLSCNWDEAMKVALDYCKENKIPFQSFDTPSPVGKSAEMPWWFYD